MKIRRFPVNMGALKVNPHKINNALVSGLYEEHIEIQGNSRSFYTYLTEDLPGSRPALIIVPPSDTDPVSFLEESGLRTLADKEKIYLFLLKSGKNGWNYDGADAGYVNQVYSRILSRKNYILVQECIYIIGVGDGTVVAHEAVLSNPENWSGTAYIGSFSHAIEDCIRKDACYHKAVQMPVYMVLTEKNRVCDMILTYWKKQNDSAETPLSGDGADEIWLPEITDRKHNLNDEKIAEIRLCYAGSEYSGLRENLKKIWRFLKRYRRHRGIDSKHLRYYAAWKEYGAELHAIEHEGMIREWYEYIPDKIKNSDQNAPLVLMMHGRTQSAEIIFDLSGMSWAAEQYGFIAVFPQAGFYQMKPDAVPNVPFWSGYYEGKNINDIGFIRRMVSDISTRRKIDSTRIYAAGFSSGGLMSYRLAAEASDMFAAICCFSGFGAVYRDGKHTAEILKPGNKIGVLLLVGAKDNAFADENQNNQYHLTDEVLKALDVWKEELGCTETGSYRCGGHNYIVHFNKQGIPLLTVCTIDDMPHAIYPTESFEAYEYLSQFSRKNGKLYFMNREVK